MQYSNENLIEGLIKNDNETIKYIYKVCYYNVSRHILDSNGTISEVKDIVQDAIVIVYKKAIKNELVLTCDFTTYFFSVCKLLWLKHLRGKRYHDKAFNSFFDPNDEQSEESLFKEGSFTTIDEISPFLKEKEILFVNHFEKLQDDCRHLLEMFFNKIPLKEIALALGYKNEDSAKNKKYVCKDALIKSIRNDCRYAELTNISTTTNL